MGNVFHWNLLEFGELMGLFCPLGHHFSGFKKVLVHMTPGPLTWAQSYRTGQALEAGLREGLDCLPVPLSLSLLEFLAFLSGLWRQMGFASVSGP